MARLAGSPEVLHSTVLAVARAVAKVEHMAETQAKRYPIKVTSEVTPTKQPKVPYFSHLQKESEFNANSDIRTSHEKEKREKEERELNNNNHHHFRRSASQSSIPTSSSFTSSQQQSFLQQSKMASTTKALLEIRRGNWMVGALQQLNHNITTTAGASSQSPQISPSKVGMRSRGQDLIPTEASQLS